MVKVKGHIDQKIVDGLKGVIDFYPHGNETIIRKWPVGSGLSQPPASVAWRAVFACFHQLYNKWKEHLDLGGFDLLPLHSWTVRDLIMSRWYGSVPHGYNFRMDTRQPWPPPCDDPLHRLVLSHPVGASYSVFGGLSIRFWNQPAYPLVIFRYRDGFSANRRAVTIRGVRHRIPAEFAPRGYPFSTGGQRAYSGPGFNFVNSSYWRLGRPLFFFMATARNYAPGTIRVSGPMGMSVSPVYFLVVHPGPSGTEWGATVEGPRPLDYITAKKYGQHFDW